MLYQILPLAEGEIAEAATVIQTVFKAHEQKAVAEFSRLFKGEQHPTYVFVAKAEGKIIGLAACLETYFSMDTYGICWVAVLEEYRQQGIATALIKTAEDFIGNKLLNGKPGTILLSADKLMFYEKLKYLTHHTLMHDGANIMLKSVNQ